MNGYINENVKNLEIIQLNTTEDGQLMALLSFQDTTNIDDLNNGYSTVNVPVNLREIQKSVRGNMLVDQSVKECVDDTVMKNDFNPELNY